MKLITALLVIYGGDPILKDRMQEAVQALDEEMERDVPFLCWETMRAIQKMKRKHNKVNGTKIAE